MDLPIKYFDMVEKGLEHRTEISYNSYGAMHSMDTLKDEAIIFCCKDKLGVEVTKALSMIESAVKQYGIENYEVVINTRPYNGWCVECINNEVWDMAVGEL